MDLSARVLGKHVADQLRERTKSVVLRIGKDAFDRHDLAGVDCFNFAAAANLSKILNRELQVKDTADVYHHIAPQALAIPRLGAVSLAVLGAAFEAKSLGGDHPLEAWVLQHTEGDKLVTFGSLKHRDEARAEQKRAAAHLSGRRSKAHRIRADRYLKRHKAS
jgi:hypothetical protein